MNVSPVLVDTDVISFLAKDHPLASNYAKVLHGKSVLVSVISIGEIEYGMESRGWGQSRREQMRTLVAGFTPMSPDTETARTWAFVKAECERKGRPIGHADAWIAATALRFNVPLITHNARDFESVPDLTVITEPSGF